MIQEIINYLKEAYEINPIAQIIGFIWFFLSVLAFLFKNDKKTKVIHGISLAFWALHFLLLWLYTAVAVDLVWIVRNFSSIKKKWSNKMILLLSFTYILFWIITYKDIYSTLPVVSWILATYAFFKLDWIKFRLLLLVCSSMWIIYSLIWHSIWWLGVELFLMTANVITIWRLILEKRLVLNEKVL